MPNPTTPQAVTDNLRNDVIDFVTKSIGDGIRTNFGAITDPAAFIASTTGAPPTLAFSKGLVRQVCRAWARGSTPIQGALADGIYGPLCKPYLDSIGETPDPARFEPSFPGGQCDSTVYRYAITAELIATPASFPLNANAKTHGPITGWRTTVEGTRLRGYVTSRSVSTAESCGVPSSALSTLTERQVFDIDNRTGYNSPRFEILGVCSGADTCGDGPGGYLPPRTVPGLPTLPPYVPNIPGISIPGIDITIDPDGNINVSIPDLGIDFTVDNPLDSGGGDPGEPEAGTPGSTGAGGEDEGEAPEDMELWALKIDINSLPENPNEYAPGVYRGVCYTYMGDDAGLDHDPAGAMLRDGQLVLAEREGLTKYRVAANPGYNLTVTPYWRKPRKES